MTDTIKEMIQLTAIKLDILAVSADHFFYIAMTQYERYITYSILGTLGLILICILVFAKNYVIYSTKSLPSLTGMMKI